MLLLLDLLLCNDVTIIRHSCLLDCFIMILLLDIHVTIIRLLL